MKHCFYFIVFVNYITKNSLFARRQCIFAFYNRIFCVTSNKASVEKLPESKDVLLLLFLFFREIRDLIKISSYLSKERGVKMYTPRLLEYKSDIIKIF